MDGPNLVLDPAQIRSDARSGKLSVEQLLDILDKFQQTIRRLEADKRRLLQRLAQYEPETASAATSGAANQPTANASYGVAAETNGVKAGVGARNRRAARRRN